MFRAQSHRIRKPNTSVEGKPFDRITIAQVWLRARTVRGQNPGLIRMDANGAWIAYREFGKRSPLGWEIDHLCPVEHGGGDELANLRVLHWANNRSKGDQWPRWDAAVFAVYGHNQTADPDIVVLRALRRTLGAETAGKAIGE